MEANSGQIYLISPDKKRSGRQIQPHLHKVENNETRQEQVDARSASGHFGGYSERRELVDSNDLKNDNTNVCSFGEEVGVTESTKCQLTSEILAFGVVGFRAWSEDSINNDNVGNESTLLLHEQPVAVYAQVGDINMFLYPPLCCFASKN
ncbi:unnamed protein product [Protopolystoma xenopodis]|uniref:Uncharacterized protein n=1 Tax=Protopolystoma xenopodis TaxID=117903 RepID=A0A448X464_9PLAT|nr:unnamed protein product [Protopolystoma xenopodis]